MGKYLARQIRNALEYLECIHDGEATRGAQTGINNVEETGSRVEHVYAGYAPVFEEDS